MNSNIIIDKMSDDGINYNGYYIDNLEKFRFIIGSYRSGWIIKWINNNKPKDVRNVEFQIVKQFNNEKK